MAGKEYQTQKKEELQKEKETQNSQEEGAQNETAAPVVQKPDAVALELELHKYVKRSGGFRKDLPTAQKNRARHILSLLHRKTVEWST